MQAFLHAAATNPSPDFAAGFVMGMVSNDYQEEIKTCYILLIQCILLIWPTLIYKISSVREARFTVWLMYVVDVMYCIY